MTCHILDTHTGVPAAGVHCNLTLLGPSQIPAPSTASSDIPSATARNTFYGTTNGDGRIATWIPRAVESTHPDGGIAEGAGSQALMELFDKTDGEMVWKLTFEIGDYWRQREIRSFFPQVDIMFVTVGYKNRQQGAAGGEGGGEREHWHVPLLIGPFSYTTYRGS
jgi:5-hydroxyisourate hydrolase